MRALTLISKMIQNLSNLSFEDKEPYMKVRLWWSLCAGCCLL